MKRNNGFTLIELLIVIAIIAIIAAIAIPNLMQSRIRANEAAAISAVRQIAAAQLQFRSAGQARDPQNASTGPTGYCDNFRNLFYGQPVGRTASNLSLIEKTIADAYAFPNGGVSGAPEARAVPAAAAVGGQQPYHGYLFTAPSGAEATDFAATFGICAVPVDSSRSGENVFFAGEDGSVYMKPVAAGLDIMADPAKIDDMLGAFADMTNPSKMSDVATSGGWVIAE